MINHSSNILRNLSKGAIETYQFLETHNESSLESVAKHLNLTKPPALRYLQELQKHNIVSTNGVGSATTYSVTKTLNPISIRRTHIHIGKLFIPRHLIYSAIFTMVLIFEVLTVQSEIPVVLPLAITITIIMILVCLYETYRAHFKS